MVTDNKYRWDFIGLSTDSKPTPATSDRVVDGSTFYCSDNSKLYVFCKDTWYEKTAAGAVTVVQTSGNSTTDVMSQKATTDFVDSIAIKNAGAPTTATVGTVGQLLEDTTNGKLYQCTAITPGTDPDPDTYTWSEVGGGSGPTVVQTTGTSTTDVMSQNATTSMVFNDPSTQEQVKIGASTTASGSNSVVIGASASCTGNNGISIGNYAYTSGLRGVSIGPNSAAGAYRGAVALGAYSMANAVGEMNVGSTNTSYGYNDTNYRLIRGVHDGQSAHDAATLAQGNTLATSAPTTSTVGVLGQLYTDTTNMHTYQCTAISGDTYTWTQRW